MYSKQNGNSRDEGYAITPPPGYDGSRFGRRSDGRDDAFPPYDAPASMYEKPAAVYTQKRQGRERRNTEIKAGNEQASYSPHISHNHLREKNTGSMESGIMPFLRNAIGREELIIIALLLSFMGEKETDPEIILLLGLLLCV
ncbi:MAG: hypothetical protein IJ499_06290 [Clostridia bacterium]|nr:hypothetical protein [Clostridia bacterium]